MTRKQREWALIALVALIAGIAGYAYNLSRNTPAPAAAAASAAMSARLPDLEGRPQSLAQWRGEVLVVNFWATWCAPCREEIPIFVKLQDKYRGRGLQFVGIAIDDAAKVRSFAAELGMNFPVLIGSVDAIELSRQLGNRAGALPFTVIFNRKGEIAAAEIGKVKETSIETLVLSLF